MTRRMILLPLALLAGCSTTAMMIPVRGPLSERRPVPTISARVDGILGTSGDLTFGMPDGDICKGRWASAAGAGLSVTSASLLSEYGPVYITGYTTSTGSGTNLGQALVACDTGRTFELEFLTGAGTASGFGIGKDNEGNIYRFVF